MSIPSIHQVIRLAKRPTDGIEPGTFICETRTTPTESDLKAGEVLVKNHAFSNDPAQRLWMDGSVDTVSSLRRSKLTASVGCTSLQF